jgi:hypothetical protein
MGKLVCRFASAPTSESGCFGDAILNVGWGWVGRCKLSQVDAWLPSAWFQPWSPKCEKNWKFCEKLVSSLCFKIFNVYRYSWGGGRKGGFERDRDKNLAAGGLRPPSAAAAASSGGVVYRALMRQLVSLAGRRVTGPKQPDAVIARAAAAAAAADMYGAVNAHKDAADAKAFEKASVYIRLFEIYNHGGGCTS